MNSKPSPVLWLLLGAIVVAGLLFALNRLGQAPSPASPTRPADPVIALSRTPRPEAATTLPPLHAAAAKGDTAALQSLCAAGTDMDARDSLGRTPLMHASISGNASAVAVLLGAGSSPSLADSQGATALFLAAGREGSTETLRVLIEAGADVNAANADNLTPLMLAAGAADAARCILLLDAGASPSARDAAGRTALDHARTRADDAGTRCAAVLEQAGAFK